MTRATVANDGYTTKNAPIRLAYNTLCFARECLQDFVRIHEARGTTVDQSELSITMPGEDHIHVSDGRHPPVARLVPQYMRPYMRRYIEFQTSIRERSARCQIGTRSLSDPRSPEHPSRSPADNSSDELNGLLTYVTEAGHAQTTNPPSTQPIKTAS